jgi:4-amino-4-deoxy-L-arabinose transferase-like glycosyltransferase
LSFRWIRTNFTLAALGAVIAGSVGLALYWVWLVPIFQSPDEDTHLNYALNIYSAGRLISVREPLHAWNSGLGGEHVYVDYLDRATGASAIQFHYSQKVAPDYGSREYYARLDAGTPAEDSGSANANQRINDGLLTIYPYGYYGLLALWIRLLRVFSGRISVLFFGARILSVVLMAVSLVLAYATCRELRFTRLRAMTMTAIVAFFPLTTFVSSYVQADNLTLTMVMLSCYLALCLKRQPSNVLQLGALGLALGGLCVTKYHVYAAVLPAVVGLVAAQKLTGRSRLGWVRLFAILLVPSLVLLAPQVWIMWGSATTPIVSGPSTVHQELLEASRRGPAVLAAFLLKGIRYAFGNFYLNRHTPLTVSTFQSFWGTFGWTDTPLVILTPSTTNNLRNCIAAFDVVLFALTLMRIIRILYRLYNISKAGRWRQALVIGFSNPLLNAYFIFTGLMFMLFALVRSSYAPQGRNWFAFILAIFLTGGWYAPRAVRFWNASNWLTVLVVGGLLLYCAVGSYYAIPSLINRFYTPPGS